VLDGAERARAERFAFGRNHGQRNERGQ
jgi:hypothetical protein